MYQPTKAFIVVLILCGDLSSWTSGQDLENAHNTRPGSLHRKARNPASSRSRGQKTRVKLTDAASVQNLSSAVNGSQLDDPMTNVSNSASNQSQTFSSTNSTSSTFQNISSAVNGSQIDGAITNPSNRVSNPSQILNSTDPASSGFQKVSSGANETQFDGSTANSSDSARNQSETLNSPSVAAPSGGLMAELPQNAMKKGDISLGFLPDDGSSGGSRQTMAQLNSQIGKKSAVYGWYAQAHSGVPFDGSQLLVILDDVKACKCVFQPAIMPVGGWQGLTSWDNSQAIAIAQVLKKFTDEGIPVWLRFAHEVNYYQTDGTYQGKASDFKAGWAAVSAAVKKIAPSVKMWWTPNVSTVEDYEAYEPNDMSTVDLVGVDYYPKKLKGNDFLDVMKGFHDKYAVNGRKFAIGETGLGWSGNIDDKTQWFNEICEAKSALPEFIAMAWFNFDKEYDYKIAGEPTLNQKFTALIAT